MLSVKACLFITLTITIGHTIAHPFSLDDKMKTGLLVAENSPVVTVYVFVGVGRILVIVNQGVVEMEVAFFTHVNLISVSDMMRISEFREVISYYNND